MTITSSLTIMGDAQNHTRFGWFINLYNTATQYAQYKINT